MRRKSDNEILCDAFRELLTNGFYVVTPDGEVKEVTDDPSKAEPLRALGLEMTKPWRNEVWRAFRKLEDRLCPVKAFEEGRSQ